MKYSLRIKREQWPDVTDTPHVIVTLHYQGHAYSGDDICFNDFQNTIYKPHTLAQGGNAGTMRYSPNVWLPQLQGVSIKNSKRQQQTPNNIVKVLFSTGYRCLSFIGKTV